MAMPGLTLPELSAWDPGVAGEGSLDPMGLAVLSDRLADVLVPGIRARMQRVRFVTAMAVGALSCEGLEEEVSADGVSTSATCFEWLVIEGFVRRLSQRGFPLGVPGSQKARSVIARGGRLSAQTYLKGPTVFGFNGVYRPFAVDAGVVGSELHPGVRASALVRAWESDQGFPGFVDGSSASEGGRLRSHIRREVRAALKTGHCVTKPRGGVFSPVARSLNPDDAGSHERRELRALITSDHHELRAELASHVARIETDMSEPEYLKAVRPSCSPALGRIVDAVVTYERLAARLDAVFRTFCAVSHSMGSQPMTPTAVSDHPVVERCARELPGLYRKAAERIAAIGGDAEIESRLGEFAIPRPPGELVELVLDHHEKVQAAKPPGGKRSWFEPLRAGWIVRPQYGRSQQPQLGGGFVHPVRVGTLSRFLRETHP